MKTIRNLPTFFICGILFSCNTFIFTINQPNYNLQDLSATWRFVHSVYPYLEYKQINWDSIYVKNYPRAKYAKGDEINKILHDMLFELKDGHVYYHNNDNREVYPYIPKRLQKDRNSFNPGVIKKYFKRDLRLTKNRKITYEIASENIGYVFLSNFNHNYMDEFTCVMDYLKSTKGLILDVRQKNGGNIDNVEAVVSRFLTKPIDRVDYYLNGKILEMPKLLPRGPYIYINPIVVLVNGLTYSAGELFSEMMKQLPNVTVVGDTTGGGSAGATAIAPGDLRLPSGKVIHIGTLDLRRYDGLPWEWLGIPPDIRVEQSELDIQLGRDKQLEFAISFLKEKQNKKNLRLKHLAVY
ncbi:MAG: S41 family peptidase [Chitinispirillia bacterium]|jgi:hypothetical protein